jgi:predicted MPP superfamily phosphohydrolase
MRLPRLTRRRFLIGLGSAALLTGGYAWRIEPHWVEVVERDLPIAYLPSTLAGKRLVQISDLHIGKLVDDDYIAEQVRRASALGDVLVITGDFMSCIEREEIDHVARILEANLHHPPLGTYAVLGNHDYGCKWRNHEVGDSLANRLRGLGVHVLRNQIADVEGLQLAGLDELWSDLFKPKKVFPRLDRGRASLVLCHNPDGADKPGWEGYCGWVLCGHTHGGQCKPPFLDPPMVPVKNPRYTTGEIPLADSRRLYINRCLGYIRRIRFNARPEITVFTLRPA